MILKASSKLYIRSLDLIIYTQIGYPKPVLSFSASADPADVLIYHTLAINIFLLSTVSAELADTLV